MKFYLFVALAVLLSPSLLVAQRLAVDNGQLDLLLSNQFLSDFGLTQVGQTDDVVRPGGLGAGSNGFPVNSRDAITRATTFVFNVGEPESGIGSIETSGRLTFDDTVNIITTGDLGIGFDRARSSSTTSGFFVTGVIIDENQIPVRLPLFDLGADTTASADATRFLVASEELTVSPEFTSILDRDDRPVPAGIRAGSISVTASVAAVPEPGSAILLLTGLMTIGLRRRR